MIIWISPYFFIPPSSGSRIRVFNLLKNVSFRKDISVISFYSSNKGETPSLTDLAIAKEYANNINIFNRKSISRLRKVFWAVFSKFPLASISLKLKSAEEEINRQINIGNIKIIQADEIYTAQYLFTSSNHNITRILVLHNVDSLAFWRLFAKETNILKKIYYFMEFIKIRKYEKSIIPKVDKCFCVSDSDKNILSKRFKGQIDIDVIPNGVDTDQMQILPLVDTPTLIFVGGMDSPPNIQAIEWFLRKVYRLVLKAIPEAFLFVVGSNPPMRLKKLETKFPVIFSGYVESIEEWYKKSRVAIAPLLVGSGTKLKILEAMAYGKPVITTSIGIEGLVFKEGVDILVADHPEDFAEKVISLLTDDGLCHRIISNARNNVEVNYDWKNISNKLDLYYQNIISN